MRIKPSLIGGGSSNKEFASPIKVSIGGGSSSGPHVAITQEGAGDGISGGEDYIEGAGAGISTESI